jgi:hypothetical protein
MAIIFVKLLSGKTFYVPYDINGTIKDIKREIFAKYDIAVERQKLILCGILLKDDELLSKLNIHTETIFHLLLKD